MLRLMAEREQIKVVHDQIGSPTSCHSLAEMLFTLLSKQSTRGIYHWTDGGEISWFDFANAIQEEGINASLLCTRIPIHSIPSIEYPAPAQRPAYSVLDRSVALKLMDRPIDRPIDSWQQRLHTVIQNIAHMNETAA